MDWFKYQKTNWIRLASVGFLVVTLAVGVSITDNPLKKQLINSFASGYSDSLIRQRERTGMCVGSGCLAIEVISNASKQGDNNTDAKSAQTVAEQKIIDTYNNSLKGDLTALAALKKMNVGLANQVQATLNSQLTADQAAIVNSYNSGNYTLNNMNEIAAQVAQICKDKPTACSALSSNNQQLTVNTQSQITLNQVIGNSANKNVFVNPESLIAQNQINSYLGSYKPPLVTIQQIQQQPNVTNLTGANNNIGAVAPPKYTSQADCQKNSGSNCGNYATQDENKNTLFTNLANSIGNVINDISAQSKKAFGPGSMFEGQNLSLGGEQPMIVAPQSVLLSENPQDFVDFYKGVGYSMGAGSLAAAAVFSPALPGIALETLTTNAGLAYALNTVTNITSVATVGYLTYGAASGPGTQAYDNAQNILVNGYLADPASMTQMFQRAGQVVSDTGAVISSIQRVPQITAPEPLALENPNVIVIEQNGQMTFATSSLNNASSTTPSIVTNMANAAETSSSLTLNTIRNNTAALAVANPADSMLFAPTYNNFINQALAVDSPGFHPNTVTNMPRWDQSTAVVNEVDLPSDLMNSLVPESLRPDLANNFTQSSQNGNIFNNSNTTQLSQTINDVSNAISDNSAAVSASNRTPIVTTITNWVRNIANIPNTQDNLIIKTLDPAGVVISPDSINRPVVGTNPVRAVITDNVNQNPITIVYNQVVSPIQNVITNFIGNPLGGLGLQNAVNTSQNTVSPALVNSEAIQYDFMIDSSGLELKSLDGKQIIVTRELGRGSEGVVSMGKFKDGDNWINVAIKRALPGEDPQKSAQNLRNDINLYRKIRDGVINARQPDLLNRITRSFGTIHDSNGNLIGYVRTFADGEPMMTGKEVVGGFSSNDIDDFKNLMEIADANHIIINDLFPSNIFGSSGRWQIIDLTPEENVPENYIVAHNVDNTQPNFDYRYGVNNRITYNSDDGLIYITNPEHQTNLQRFNNMVRFFGLGADIPPTPTNLTRIATAIQNAAISTFTSLNNVVPIQVSKLINNLADNPPANFGAQIVKPFAKLPTTPQIYPTYVDINNLPSGTRPEVADAIRYANDHGIEVYSLPPDQMGLTNPSIEGGARTTGGIARYPNAQAVTISERLFLPQHPDAARIIYHEVAGHMIGQQFPPSTLADRIINEILAQRTASLMLTNRGLPAYPNGFANLDGLINRYRELTGIDPYVVLDIITRAPIVERVENLTGVSLNNPNSSHGLIQNTIDSFLPLIPKQIAQLFPNIFGVNLQNTPLSPELVKKSFGIIMPDVGDGLVTYMRAHDGSLDGATIRFEDGRVWSAYYDKTTSPYNELRSRGGEVAVDEMVSRLDAGFRKANSKLFLSPKSRSTTTDHIVYIDITQSRSSSIAKASKFFNNAAKTIIDDVNNKYGIVDGSRKVSDYMYTGIGDETPVIFKNDDGLVSQEAEKNAIQGALLGSAGPVVPESLKGDDYEPIIEYRGKENADVVVPIKKNITLYGNVIKKSDVGVIIPDTPSGIVATPEEIDKITKSVGFDNHRTPQDIISLFDSEAQSQFGNKEIRVKLEDTTAIKIEHDLGEGAGISVDVSPYSDMKETIREITGVSGSDEEIGLNQIMARVLADSKKVGSANKIAGDGLEIFIKKLTPNILRNLLDLSTSINTHLENALNGVDGYTQFELKVAHLLDLNFNGQVLVKIGAVNTKATFVAYEANDDGYIPTEIITEKSTDPYMATSKNFKKAYGVDKKVVTLSPELIKDFAPKELSDVGIKVDSDPLTGDVLLTELPITNSPPSPSMDIQDRTKELINNAQNFVEDKIRTIKGINLFNKAETTVNDIQVGHSLNPLIDASGLFPTRISLPFLEPQILNTNVGSSSSTAQQTTIKLINIINGQNSYFKTGSGIPLWQAIGGALALYILDRDQINKFLRELYTTPPSNMYKAFGKAVSNLRNNGSTTLTNQDNIPASTVVENEQLNKVGIFMQRDNLTVKQIINPWGTTLLELGCGPSSAINAFRLLGIEVDPQNIINGFYWDPETHQTGASAVLLSLQQNGVSGAVNYGLQNQITDATKISSYTGMLIYGGTASNNTEKKNHIAIITCNKGNCYSIDSYFSNGKPVKCTVQSSSSIQCGDYNYHIGETKGNADALLPIIDSDKNAILPSLTNSLTPVKSDTESQSAPQVITSTDNQVGPEKDLFNDKVVYKNFTTEDNILYHVVNFDLNNVNMFVDSHFGQRTTTSNFLETNGLDIAINGDGWIKAYDKKDPSIFLGYQTGFSISNGNVNPLYNNKNQIMYLDSDHKMQFVDNPKDIPSNVEYAVSFVNWLVEDGQISTQVTNRDQDYLNPRTAIGITKDNQAFIIVTDGKEYSSGMLMKDLAQLMKDMGAVNAVMFDGGTNSTMVINGEGTVEKNCNDGGECQVANHVGFKIIP